MSYEGYIQFLCRNGHAFSLDVYEVYETEDSPRCPVCKEPPVWRNSVDQTNGSHDPETGERIDGYVELELAAPGKTCKCDHCGVVHLACPPTYKIPEKKPVVEPKQGGSDGVHDEAPSGT